MRQSGGGGGGSIGFAINSSGQTVGYATNASGIAQAFRTTATGGIDQASMLVAAPGVAVEKSEALSINDAGQTVGTYQTANAQLAFFADADGVMQNLDSLITNNSRTGISLALSINNEGQILAASQTAFWVLTPVTVPEPGAFFFMSISSVSLLLRARRR